MQRTRTNALAAAAGSLIGAGLLGTIGSTAEGFGHLRGATFTGGVAGMVFGGIVGWGAASGWVHRVTVWAILFGLIMAALGPGFDDTGGVTILPGALFGAVLAWLGWPWLLGFLGGVAGAVAGALAAAVAPYGLREALPLVGFALGAIGAARLVMPPGRRAPTDRAGEAKP